MKLSLSERIELERLLECDADLDTVLERIDALLWPEQVFCDEHLDDWAARADYRPPEE